MKTKDLEALDNIDGICHTHFSTSEDSSMNDAEIKRAFKLVSEEYSIAQRDDRKARVRLNPIKPTQEQIIAAYTANQNLKEVAKRYFFLKREFERILVEQGDETITASNKGLKKLENKEFIENFMIKNAGSVENFMNKMKEGYDQAEREYQVSDDKERGIVVEENVPMVNKDKSTNMNWDMQRYTYAINRREAGEDDAEIAMKIQMTLPEFEEFMKEQEAKEKQNDTE